MDAAWTHSTEEVLKHLQVNPAAGLSQEEALKRTEKYGKNGE